MRQQVGSHLLQRRAADLSPIIGSGVEKEEEGYGTVECWRIGQGKKVLAPKRSPDAKVRLGAQWRVNHADHLRCVG